MRKSSSRRRRLVHPVGPGPVVRLIEGVEPRDADERLIAEALVGGPQALARLAEIVATDVVERLDGQLVRIQRPAAFGAERTITIGVVI